MAVVAGEGRAGRSVRVSSRDSEREDALGDAERESGWGTGEVAFKAHLLFEAREDAAASCAVQSRPQFGPGTPAPPWMRGTKTIASPPRSTPDQDARPRRQRPVAPSRHSGPTRWTERSGTCQLGERQVLGVRRHRPWRRQFDFLDSVRRQRHGGRRGRDSVSRDQQRLVLRRVSLTGTLSTSTGSTAARAAAPPSRTATPRRRSANT